MNRSKRRRTYEEKNTSVKRVEEEKFKTVREEEEKEGKE